MANTYPVTLTGDALTDRQAADPGYDPNTQLYNALVNKVYDWSNRDIAALPPQIVRDSVRYAADTAYRTLRIPPLENTIVWTDFPITIRIDTLNTNTNITTEGTDQVVTDQAALDTIIEDIATFNAAAARATDSMMQSLTTVTAGPLTLATSGASTIYQSVTLLSIPSDLTEFIQIRGTDATGLTTRVFNEKADVRTFQDISADVYNIAGFWTRMGNNVLFTPSFSNAARGFYGGGAGPETRIEMYYYRRLPALNAQYDATFTNWMLGLGTLSTGETFATGNTQATFDALIEGGSVWTGRELVHWLRDENEKIPLMGALAECFAYLQEDDQAQKYLQLFQKEITELNDEDKMRDASGGNIQVHFNGRGLI